MNLDELGRVFRQAVSASSVTVPERTLLHAAGCEILEMAAAYADDGQTFLTSGDAVNALASFAYGNGWLDAGRELGLIRSNQGGVTLPDASGTIPYDLHIHLHEKTGRYRRMLEKACCSVACAPEPQSPVYPGCDRILDVARRSYGGGCTFLEQGECANALASFSYGYGWLDAGVRCGLLWIERNRDLFTI
ncbi:MAG: hypothetical protein APR53_01510 [Methanoculleus sp. SDB]|nr:MAG: hypothetical protein APR53_01510 [Methanoculleus sp. SDB]